MKYDAMSLREYIEILGAGTAVPGGGSAAALSGALAAALAAMTANLTISKDKYRNVREEMDHLAAEARDLAGRCLGLAQADPDAYEGVMAAYRLPRETEEEKEARREAVRAAFKAAADVPFETLRTSERILKLAHAALKQGNINCLTDAWAAVLPGPDRRFSGRRQRDHQPPGHGRRRDVRPVPRRGAGIHRPHRERFQGRRKRLRGGVALMYRHVRRSGRRRSGCRPVRAHRGSSRAAEVLRHEAPGPEAAPGGGVYGGRDFAGEDDLVASPGWIRNRNGREERPGVRVEGRAVECVRRPHFDDLSKVHDPDPLRDVPG